MAVKINILCLSDNKIHYVVFFSLQNDKYLISGKNKGMFKNYNNFKRKQNNDERRKNSR